MFRFHNRLMVVGPLLKFYKKLCFLDPQHLQFTTCFFQTLFFERVPPWLVGPEQLSMFDASSLRLGLLCQLSATAAFVIVLLSAHLFTSRTAFLDIAHQPVDSSGRPFFLAVPPS